MRIAPRRSDRRHDRRRGATLLAVIVVLFSLLGMAAAVLSTTLYQHGNVRGTYERERAYEVARAGIDLALFELRADTDVDGGGVGVATGASLGGEYTVTVDPPFVGPGQYILRARGEYGVQATGVEFVVGPDVEPGYGLFASDSLEMSGSFGADSYRSLDGSYASQVVGDHAGESGVLGSNGDIEAGGGTIWGDARPGPGMQVLGDPSNVTGSTAPMGAPVTFSPYVYSPAIASGGSWNGPGALATGSYRFDDLTVSGGGVLTLTGDVTIYVDGDLTLSGGSALELAPGATLTLHHGPGKLVVSGGGIINPDENPQSVEILSSTSDKIELSGGSSFYGQVYAPDSQFVSSGGSHLYGAVVSRTAKCSGGGQMHHDLSLSTGGGTGFEVLSARPIPSDEVVP